MRAMLLDEPGTPLRAAEVEMPEPGPGQLLLRVHACGVCRTDLHLRDGEVEAGHLPLILGHQIVATDRATAGASACRGSGWTDGECAYCRSGRENLCPNGALHRPRHRRRLRRVRGRRRALLPRPARRR